MLAERVQFCIELAESLLELVGVEVACLEGVVVAIQGAFGAADLVGKRAMLLFERRPIRLRFGARVFERLCDQLAVAVEPGELIEDGGLELVAVQAVAGTAFRAELLAAGASVVVVGAAVALGGHADVGAFAAAATDEAGEQEVGAVTAAQAQVLAALFQQRLRLSERPLVDQWLVEAGVALAAPGDTAEVRLVAQHEPDGGGLPATCRGRCAFVGEQAGDRDGAEPVLRVEPEDALHDGSLALVGDDELVFVAAVAEGDAAGGPAAFLGAAFDAGADPVDDRGVLELRKHGQHLQHHPAGGCSGIERLGRRAQGDTDAIEFVGELRKLAHLA